MGAWRTSVSVCPVPFLPSSSDEQHLLSLKEITCPKWDYWGFQSQWHAHLAIGMSAETRKANQNSPSLWPHSLAQGRQSIFARSIRYLLGIFYTVPGIKKEFFPWRASCKTVTSELSVTMFPAVCTALKDWGQHTFRIWEDELIYSQSLPLPLSLYLCLCLTLTHVHTHTQLVNLIWLTLFLALLPLCVYVCECVCVCICGLVKWPN